MKNVAVRCLVSFTVLLFLALSLAMACAQPNVSPPLTPHEPPAQPSAVSENQTPEEPPPVSEAVAAISSPVIITSIRYKGTVYSTDPDNCICYERIEPDEYVVIKNLSETHVKMGGWVLKNITKGYPSFTFPLDFVFGPGQIVRVYTDEVSYGSALIGVRAIFGVMKRLTSLYCTMPRAMRSPEKAMRSPRN
jgi:hypothetical protein